MTETEPGGGKILGVLGGMGPLASAYFMMRLTQLTPAASEEEHVPAVLWSDPRVPNRLQAQRGTGPSPLPWLVHGIQKLAEVGCGAVAIPCNTAHGWIDGMRAASPIPILHIIDAAADDLRRQGVVSGRVGVLATEATLAMRLYQDWLQRLGWSVIEPSAEEMKELVSPSIALVKENRLAEAYRLAAEAVLLLQDRGRRRWCWGARNCRWRSGRGRRWTRFWWIRSTRWRWRRSPGCGSSLVAVATWGGTVLVADDVMVDPLGDEAAGLVERGFGVMDAVERRAGRERVDVGRAFDAKLSVGRDDGPLAASGN